MLPDTHSSTPVLVRASRLGEVGRQEVAEVVQDAWLARASSRRGQAWLEEQQSVAAGSRCQALMRRVPCRQPHA